MKPTVFPSTSTAIGTTHSGEDPSLKSGGATLRFVFAAGEDFGLRLEIRGARFAQEKPLALEVIGREGAVQWLERGYSRVTVGDGVLNGQGTLTSPHGTQFRFQDRYTRDADGFQLERRVEVLTPHPDDVGFSSRFGLAWGTPETTRDTDVLMPGAWYRDNTTVPPRAFAAHPEMQVLLYREDRLGIPLVAALDRKAGTSLVLERVGGAATTVAGDRGGERLIEERFQVGALGILNAGYLTLAFTFPATEDERPMLGGPVGPRFAPRSHPVKVGIAHTYTLHFSARKTASFAALVSETTRAAITRANPPLIQADLNRVYRASMDLLDTVTQSYNGTVAVPFQVVVPSGEIKDTSSQMGFVGMALPCAALLLRDGWERGNTGAVQHATQVVDFWVRESPGPAGIPKTWCDFPAPDRVTWRGYPTHLRVASDAMRGVLRAWEVARLHHTTKPEWLAFARAYGDFLVKNQNVDGSWFGSWNLDGTPRDRYTNASTHPIPFLTDLSRATGDAIYRKAALRAGDFCWRAVHQAYSYVGGTPDNPNVTDKEAGVIAVDAFLALADASGDRKWLDAARQAALFCETWVYWRNLPMPDGDPKQVFPRGRSTVGLSLISTGHSGADNFMAAAPFLWYRLYLATGDSHFLTTARLLLHDTKQILNWDGSLGYKYPGLLPEAMGLATERGRGIAGWLPWLTFTILEPLVRLQETFGDFDIDRIERLPLPKRQELNRQFATTRGYKPTG